MTEPKQTEEQPKHFDRKHILVFFRKYRVVSGCFGLFRFVSVFSVCFGCFASIPRVLMFQLNRNSLIESIFCYFLEKFGLFWFISVCFETVLFVSNFFYIR